jgi:hypothetical protein
MRIRKIKVDLSQIGSTVMVQFISLVDDESVRDDCCRSAKILYESIEENLLKSCALDLEKDWHN